MKLEQKHPTKSLADRESDVLKALTVLEEMPNFPKSEKTLNFTARMLATFIETVEVHHYNPDDPDWPHALGWVVPLDWIVAEVGQTFYSFPAPIKWREIYGKYFPPLDGRYAADILAAIGE